LAKKSLIGKRGNKTYSKTIEILDSPSNFISITSEMAWKILKTLNEKPMYPNELAKKLKIHEQKIYYHIRRMEKAGLISVVKEEYRRGAVCKYFAPVSQAFGFELPGGEEEIKLASSKINPSLKEFFHEFIKTGTFDGSIIVGSPTPHGPFLTAARDGHYAVQLAMFLGNFCTLEKRFVVKLDTEAKAENSLNRNMVVVGGPITNMVCSDLNEKLKVRFLYDGAWSIFSERTNTKYTDELDALIARIKNPWDETKKIILLSGLKFEGTKTSILAITDRYEKILEDFDKNKDFYCVIRGLDKDGDGKVDDIKILEVVS
jgi:DNA-binding transcriptional ArsR family regulator